MKKCLMMILLTTFFSLCSSAQSATEHKMSCVHVGLMVRCENDEAICYKSSNLNKAGVSCYFKQTLIIKDSVNALNSTNNITD